MVTIEPFTIANMEGVIGLILPIQQDEFKIPIMLEDQPDLLNIPSFYQKGNGNFWVALADGHVVGTIALLDIGGGLGALRKMFVLAEYRGAKQGVARLLLETLLAWCRLKEMSAIYLGTTVQFLAAHRFYEKNGFSQINKSDLPQTFPVMRVDSRFYCLTIKNHLTQAATS